MLKNKKDIILIISMFLGLTFLGFGYKFFISNKNEKKIENVVKQNEKIKDEELAESNKKDSEIYIHIDGEINKPGVYKMKLGDRVDDAIKVAGGLTDNAEKNSLNLAVKLKDEMKIHIYKIGETQNNSNAESSSNSQNSNSNNLVNINTASKEELCKLTGIGETKAKLIIEYREKNKFNKIEDITKVSGIGKKTFEKIKNNISVY